MDPRTVPDVLVGRAAETRVLTGLVDAVGAGRGGSVWLEGEPGIGKSVLLRAALAEAPRVAEVYVGSAYDGDRLFPLRVVLDALRVGPDAPDPGRLEIVGVLQGAGTSAFTPTDVVAAAAERLLVLVQRLCADSPVVLAIDDVQWADEVSLSVWRRLHEVSLQAPLLLIAACRPVPQRREVDALRAALADRGAVLVGLPPLRPEHVEQVVAGLVGAAVGPGLRQQAGLAAGNPLYARELVDAWAREDRIRIHAGVADLVDPHAPAPPSLSAAISARLGFLSERALPVVRVAALLGSQFTAELLALATGRDIADLHGPIDEAAAAGVLAPVEHRLSFRHPLIRQALAEQMPAGVRSALHRHIAQVLAEAGEPVEAISEHVAAATTATDTWTRTWIAEAAPGLVHRAPRLAAQLLQRVREQINNDDQRRDYIDANLVTALALLGQYRESARLAQAVLARTDDSDVRGQMAWTAGRALRHVAHHEQALAVVEDVLRDPDALTPGWRARLRALYSFVLMGAGRFKDAETTAAQAKAESGTAGDRIALAHSLRAVALSAVLRNGDSVEFLKVTDEAVTALGDDSGEPDLRMWLLLDRVDALETLGRPMDAEHALTEAMIEAERSGLPPHLARARAQAADFHFLIGRWDEALSEVEGLADYEEVAPALRLFGHGIGALIAHQRDKRDGVDAHRAMVSDIEVTGGDLRYASGYLRVAEALSAERRGDPAAGLALLLAIVDNSPTGEYDGRDVFNCAWLPDIVRLATATDDAAAAATAARICAAAETTTGQPRIAAAAQHCRGLLDASPTIVEAAAATFGGAGYVLWQGQALEDAAVLHARQRDPASARAAYQQAINIYVTLDAAWNIRRADTRLRELGIRRGQTGARTLRPTTGWRALTPTEHTVANLVAAGLSNPDIAEQLFISRRTVGTHVTHILTKLHAQSRVDIAREATSHSGE